jgi:hypothetical protein
MDQCSRCQRVALPADSSGWWDMRDGRVCPDCITPEEDQALYEAAVIVLCEQDLAERAKRRSSSRRPG